MSALAVAGVTWRAAVRDRVLHLLGGCAVAAIGCSRAIGWVTPGEDVKVMTDLTLSTLALFSVCVAVILGARLLREDIDRRTLYTICAKDVSRVAVLLGKYGGLLAAFAVALGVGAAVAAGYVAAMGGTVGLAYAAAVAGVFAQLAVLVAASLFFSTLASPIVAAGATLGVFVVGNSVPVLAEFREVWRPGLARDLAGVLQLVLPNLANCRFFDEASHALPVDPARALAALGTAAAWSAVFLAAAWAVFRRKDL